MVGEREEESENEVMCMCVHDIFLNSVSQIDCLPPVSPHHRSPLSLASSLSSLPLHCFPFTAGGRHMTSRHTSGSFIYTVTVQAIHADLALTVPIHVVWLDTYRKYWVRIVKPVNVSSIMNVKKEGSDVQPLTNPRFGHQNGKYINCSTDWFSKSGLQALR